MGKLGLSSLAVALCLTQGLTEPDCCQEKTVGGVAYRLVEETDTSGFGCKSNCVYEKKGSPGSRICFKKGLLEVVCEQKLGILISGGFDTDTTVEVYSPGQNIHCLLPPIPVEMFGHTSEDLTLCGGRNTRTTCITFSSGQWGTSHALTVDRDAHTSWNNKEEGKIILIGGWASLNTTETLTDGEYNGVPGFTMKYDTQDACPISDPSTNSVIITGGLYTLLNVSRYGTAGYIEDLPSLNQGRAAHGCGAYADSNGEQVFLVAGGWTNSTSELSSTEILTRTSSNWVTVESLPRRTTAVRGVTLGDILYMTGGHDGGSSRDEIYKWTGKEWKEVERMKKTRAAHAVSTIRMDEIKDFCT